VNRTDFYQRPNSLLKELLKTTSKYIAILEANGITTPQDFLEYFPRNHEDRTKITKLSDLFFEDINNHIVTVHAKIISKKMISRGKNMMWELLIQDQNRNQAQLLFARKAYQLREVKKDQRYMVIGKAIVKYGTITFRYPEILASSEP